MGLFPNNWFAVEYKFFVEVVKIRNACPFIESQFEFSMKSLFSRVLYVVLRQASLIFLSTPGASVRSVFVCLYFSYDD
tara:strand:+ start:529 stop:762 length:234 start_codon:yes stop_codon:yes gene_type:complete